MTEVPQVSVQNPARKASRSSRLKLPQNLLQNIQIEKYRLHFLQRCEKFKRPPQSLRISGANALENSLKLSLFSDLESKLLSIAIIEKKKGIKNLQEQLENTAGLVGLNRKDRKAWYTHFDRKIEFYKKQDTDKWTQWPQKKSNTSTNKNKSVSNNNKLRKLYKKRKNIQKRAISILENKQVRILVDIDVPDEAIVVLGKGLGFVPTPVVNNERLRLDARHVVNKITQKCKINEDVQKEGEPYSTTNNIPTKLKQINYHQNTYKIKDSSTKQAVDIVNCKMNALSPNSVNKTSPKNLSHLEYEGLKWIQRKTSNMEIAITKADKGGSILIVPVELLENKIKEKVLNPSLFDQIEKDPRPDLYNELHIHWVQGKLNKHVTDWEAERIMGITNKNNKSSSSHFKPGVSYFNPNLKIHKMKEEDIIIGCDPPARLISCFQDGVTKRSDVFVADKWLKSLEDDFCTDKVSDTIDTLKWLENLNSTASSDEKKTYLPFTFDFESLYDSLTPDLVIKAVRYSIKKHRKDWSQSFVEWLIKLIKMSLNSGVGFFQNKWFKSKSGISTGGSLSVQLANITVFYVLHLCVYSNKDLTKNIVSIKRFIDDGTGIFKGSIDGFNIWKTIVSRSLNKYKLNTPNKDWTVASLSNYVHFLDIQYGFDFDGNLQTDLFRKETDSRAYLDFRSCHPNHVFSSIVYSQALRIRRIVNDQTRFEKHLNDLAIDFTNSNYPSKLVSNIIDKVSSLPRSLESSKNTTNEVESEVDTIRIVSTFGCDQELVKTFESVSKLVPFKFDYVKRTGAPLEKLLCKSKHISTGPKYGKSTRCNRTKCKSCFYMSDKDSIIGSSGRSFRTASGSCSSKNLIYAASCNLCRKVYVGKTTRMLCGRIFKLTQQI